MKNPKFGHIVVGDKVTRMLAGKIPIEMIVTHVKNSVITCENEDKEGEKRAAESGKDVVEKFMGMDLGKLYEPGEGRPFWQFSANTGGEIDLDLGWDGITTGSYIIDDRKTEENETKEGV